MLSFINNNFRVLISVFIRTMIFAWRRKWRCQMNVEIQPTNLLYTNWNRHRIEKYFRKRVLRPFRIEQAQGSEVLWQEGKWYSSGQKFCCQHQTSIASHLSPIWGMQNIAWLISNWSIQINVNQEMDSVPYIGLECEAIEVCCWQQNFCPELYHIKTRILCQVRIWY